MKKARLGNLGAIILEAGIALLLLHGLPDTACAAGAATPGEVAPSATAPSLPAAKTPGVPAAANEWLFAGDAFEGTFVQLTEAHRQWPAAQWRSEFGNLRRLGMKIVIVQWTQYDAADFSGGAAGEGAIETVVAAADAAGIDLYVGLSLRRTWWQTECFTGKYMAEELARNTRLADTLFPRLKTHRSFRGWYIPHEVTDVENAGDAQNLLLAFFRALTAHLHKLDALKPVLASGYTDPDKSDLVHLAAWWALFFREAGVDIVIFQDGAGIPRKSPWQDTRPLLNALAALEDEFRAELWLAVETFTQTHGKPVDAEAFAAKPADFPRVRQQIEQGRSLKKRMVAYSYFDYMRPSAGKEAAQLYDAYRQFVEATASQSAGRAATVQPPPAFPAGTQ